MRAYPAAHGWEGVAFLNNPQGLHKISVSDMIKIFLNIDMGRASADAWGHTIPVMISQKGLKIDLPEAFESG